MNDLAIEAIQGALHGLAARQRTIADNISNSETPGFLAGQVSFESSLADAISNGGDPSTVQPTTSRSTAPTNLQGNNVSLDDETVSAMKTDMSYQLMIEAMTSKFNLLRLSISGKAWSMFNAMNTAGSSLHVYRTWLDAISDNIANINTARPTSGAAFQQRMVVAEAVPSTDGTGIGNGAAVAGVTFGDPAGRVVNDPSNPLADARGNVRMPDIDLGDQMVQMLVAERGYQANLATVSRAKDSYQAALELGK